MLLGSSILCPLQSSRQVANSSPGWRITKAILCRGAHLYPSPGRRYASANSLGETQKITSRKQVTVVNDDGRVPWKDLTVGEAAARTTQQTFNYGIVMAGAIGTGLVVYFLYQEVFASDSKTRVFDRAVDQVRTDPQALELLGYRKTLRAFGEPSSNKWTRNRPLAARTYVDRTGIEHIQMHFNVEGSERSGVVSLDMVKGPDQKDFQYQFLVLDVPGHPRVYLENAESSKGLKRAGFKMLGVQWR